MNGVNLIPAHRRTARERRLRIRRWTIACSAYAVLLGGACAIAHAMWAANGRDIQAEASRAASQVEEVTARLNAATARIARASIELETAQAITDRPDWSVLLAALSSQTGNDVVLSAVRLEPTTQALLSPTVAGPVRVATKDVSVPGAIQPACWRMDLQGHGRSQPAVSQFIIRLQETRLFREVKLVRTHRGTFLGGEAIAFQVQCTLGPQERAGQ